MINDKKLIILTVITIVVAFGAYQSSQNVVSPSIYKNTSENKKLLPDLEKNLHNIGTVIIRSKGKSFKVSLTDGQWVMPNKYSYIVPTSKIRDLVNSSAQAVILEEKNISKEYFSSLGLADPEEESGSATRIVLLSADEKTTYADYIRGENRKAVSGNARSEVYARLFNSDQAFLVQGDLNFDLSAHTLLSGETFAIPSDKMQSIDINYTGKKKDNFTLKKNILGQPDFEISNPKGKELKAFSKAKAVATSLQYMIIEDIIPVEKFIDKKPELTATYKTFGGLQLVVSIFKHNSDSWLIFKASSYDGNDISTNEASRINKLAANWVYKVSARNSGGFYYKLGDLTEK